MNIKTATKINWNIIVIEFWRLNLMSTMFHQQVYNEYLIPKAEIDQSTFDYDV